MAKSCPHQMPQGPMAFNAFYRRHWCVCASSSGAPRSANRHISAATGDSMHPGPPRPLRLPSPRNGLSLRYACAGGPQPGATGAGGVWRCVLYGAGWLLGRCVGEPVAVESTSQLASLCMHGPHQHSHHTTKLTLAHMEHTARLSAHAWMPFGSTSTPTFQSAQRLT